MVPAAELPAVRADPPASKQAAISVLLAGLGLLVPLCQAADKPAPAKPRPANAVISKAELRACIEQKDGLRSEVERSETDASAVAASKADIARQASELAELLAALDRSNADAVAAYNARAAARDQAIDAVQARVAAHNAQAEALRASQAAYARSCENRRYDERDEAEIRKGK